MKWLSLQDDELPTWAHTVLTLAIASAFAVPLFWYGIRAVATGYLEPIMGPELGHWWFGSKALTGRAAVIAGWALLAAGSTFLSLGAAFCRWAEGRILIRLLPWGFLALHFLLYARAMSAT